MAVRSPRPGKVRTIIPWKLARTPGRIRMAPPCLGPYNEEVLEALLGLSPEETTTLSAQGVTERPPGRQERD